jgi:hypothetical protein
MIRLLALILLSSAASSQEGAGFVPSASVSQYDEADEVALREYVDVRLDAIDRSLQVGLETQKEAVEKASIASNERFQSVNEFRGQLGDQARTFLPRLEYEQAHQALINSSQQATSANAQRIDALTERFNDWESRSAGATEVWPILFGAVGLIGVLFGIYMAMANRPPPARTRRP